jgi:hypothetical protein
MVFAVAAAHLAAQTCVAPPPGLVSWWSGDGTANDLIAGNHGALVGGASYAPGMVGQTFRFDGTTGYVRIPHHASLTPQTFSIAAWIKPDPVNMGVAPIFKKPGNQDSGYAFEFWNGNFDIAIWFFTPAGWAGNWTMPVTPGQWSHVAGMYDGGVGRVAVNGVPGRIGFHGWNIIHGTGELNIAHDPGDPLRYYRGDIDEVMFFNRGLSDAELLALHNAGPSGLCGNTSTGANVQVLPFDTASGTSPASVLFSQITQAGSTNLATSASGPAPPAGYRLGTPPAYYELTTTAVYSGPITVCINYPGGAFTDESTLQLAHFEGGAWVDRTVSLDTANNVICAGVSSLSPFAVFERIPTVVSLGPAKVWIGLANSDDVGIRFDLRVEVHRNGSQLVGSGELASVHGGSSGFNNAQLHTIGMTPVAGAAFSSGDTLSTTLYVRNACSGSGKNSGRARLWYNDAAANSRFDATITNPATYYLGDSFVLGVAAGAGPRRTMDVAAGSKCSPYKTFGTWSRVLP